MAVVMGVLIVSFGIWGIADIFRGFGQSTLAKVGHTEISMNEFRQIYTDRIQQIGRQFGRPFKCSQRLRATLQLQQRDTVQTGQFAVEGELFSRLRCERFRRSEVALLKQRDELADGCFRIGVSADAHSRQANPRGSNRQASPERNQKFSLGPGATGSIPCWQGMELRTATHTSARDFSSSA